MKNTVLKSSTQPFICHPTSLPVSSFKGPCEGLDFVNYLFTDFPYFHSLSFQLPVDFRVLHCSPQLLNLYVERIYIEVGVFLVRCQ